MPAEPVPASSVDRAPRAVALVVLAVGSIVGAVAFAIRPYVFEFYGDANSRLVQTRMIADAVSPGIHWLGTVWLPLPQLLFLPFSLIDPFFRTGFAGFAVCMPLLAWSAALLYRLLVRLTGERAVSMAVALSYALNPNMLYISMTAMTETVTLFFTIAALWNWARWIGARATSAPVAPLFWGSLSVAGATLCRYEAWPFAALGFAGVAVMVLTLKESVARRTRLLGVAALSFLGIGLWLWWNWAEFGDPLYFHHAEYYSAAWQAQHRQVSVAYYLQLMNSLAIYAETTMAVYGPWFLLAAAAGAWLFASRRPRIDVAFFAPVLLIMPAFTVWSLYLGVAEMTHWWNSRYVLLLAPLVAVCVAVAVAGWSRRGGPVWHAPAAVAVAFLATVAYQVAWQPGYVVTVADAAGGFYYRQAPFATKIAERLRGEWSSGMILCATGSDQAHRVIQPSGVPTRHFVVGLNHDRQLYDVDAAARDFEWIVVAREPSSDGAEIANFFLGAAAALGRTFDRVEENDFYVVYRRRPPPGPGPAPGPAPDPGPRPGPGIP